MYDRSTRLLTCTSNATPPNIGPGTYDSQVNSRNAGRENYAPFHSTKTRVSFLSIGPNVAAAPGPGHYNNIIAGEKSKGGVCDRSLRFAPVKSVTPGPGAYTTDVKWSKGYQPAEQKQDKRMRPMNYIHPGKHKAGPSIPAFGQNYGFEDVNGDLKPQEMPNYDHTLGPAFYNVSQDNMVSQKYKGTHFGQLSSKRIIFEDSTLGPGPAAYQPMENGASMSNVTASVNSSRQAKVLRYHEPQKMEKTRGIPGPGQYLIKSQFQPLELDVDGNVPMIPFGSSVERFGTKIVASPGCTSYTDPRTAFETTNRLTGIKHTPFGQTSTRFKSDKEAAQKPGPGAYEDEHSSSMVVDMMKKIMNAPPKKPFGTTEARTVPMTKKDDFLIPGPGAYERLKSNSVTSKPSFSFPVASKRFPLLAEVIKDNPSPATYEVSKPFNKSHGNFFKNGRIGFLSQPNRFGGPTKFLDESTRENPGPGEYEYTGPKEVQYSGLICGKEERFRRKKATTPGPASYSMPVQLAETTLKGTFNVSLNNPLKKVNKYTVRHMA